MAVDPIRDGGDPHARVAGIRAHALFEEHGRMVYGLCRTLLRDAHDADDATQAVFVSAYCALLGGSEPLQPAAWLATIARHECGARAKARMREPLPLADAEVPSMLGPEAELERRAAAEELCAAIAALPEKQREAVVLRELYGLRYDEVGAALGMSVASVESLLFRARRRLRVRLRPLVGGGLAVPVAVREGIAQAIPSIAGAGAAGAGPGGCAAGIGLLGQLAAGPAVAKVAAGVAAVAVAGSVAVAKVERVPRSVAVEPQAPHVAAESRARTAATTVAQPVTSRPLHYHRDTRAHQRVRAQPEDGDRTSEPVVISVAAPVPAPTPPSNAQPPASARVDEEGPSVHHDGPAARQPAPPPLRQGEPRAGGSDSSGPGERSGPSGTRDAEDGPAETPRVGADRGSGPDGSIGVSGDTRGGDDLLAVDAASSEETSSGPGGGGSGSALHADGGESSGPALSDTVDAPRDPGAEEHLDSGSHKGGGGSDSGPGSASTS